jgi:imidazolonepropionase-like amidohydrolase
MNALPNAARRALLLASAGLFAAGMPARAQDYVAVKAGKIVTVAGPTIDDGVILIHNGRIQKVAKAADVEIPWDARVVDATGRTVLPTWVLAHSQGGLGAANENMQNVPFVSVADAVDPASTFFEDCLRQGVGTVHVIPGNQTLLGGIGMVLRPFGRTVEDMAVSTRSGLKLSLAVPPQGGGRLQQIRKLRRALEEVREYVATWERRKQEFEQEKKAGAIPADKEWTEEIDRTKKPVVDLLDKKLKGWLYVPSSAEVDEALRLSQQLDLNVVLGERVHKAIAEIAKLKATVVLDDTLEFWETDEETQAEKKICPAKLLADAGVPFAISLSLGGPGSNPWWQLATLVRNGVDRRAAIESLTLAPARLLGLDDQIGSLAEGKLANLQVLSGDPLQATTWVETVILEGKVVYEKGKDPRLQFLFVQAKKDDAAKPPEKKADEKKPDVKNPDEKRAERQGQGQ